MASAWKWTAPAQRAGAWRAEAAPGRVGVILVEGDALRPAHEGGEQRGPGGGEAPAVTWLAGFVEV